MWIMSYVTNSVNQGMTQGDKESFKRSCKIIRVSCQWVWGKLKLSLRAEQEGRGGWPNEEKKGQEKNQEFFENVNTVFINEQIHHVYVLSFCIIVSCRFQLNVIEFLELWTCCGKLALCSAIWWLPLILISLGCLLTNCS